MFGVIVALLSGALMSIQGVFNTAVTKSTAVWLAAAWVQLTGFITCIIIWAISERKEVAIGKIFDIDNKYMLIGGVMGAFITWSVIKSMGEMGPARAVLIIVITQVLVAYLIEVFGVFTVEKIDFQWSKLMGIVVAIVGIVIFKWDK